MPLRKIKDYKNETVCRSPEHNPPGMQVFEPGEYEWECPSCGNIQTFIVDQVTL